MIEYAKSDVEFHRSVVRYIERLDKAFKSLEKRVSDLEVANRKSEDDK